MAKKPKHMGQNQPKHPGQNQPKQIEVVFIKPPKDIDESPPAFANQVRAIGGSDALTLHFYYISPSRIGTILGGGKDDRMSVSGNTLTIESEPVARVAVPLSVVTQLIATLAESLVGGLPELQEALGSMDQRLTDIPTLMNKVGLPTNG